MTLLDLGGGVARSNWRALRWGMALRFRSQTLAGNYPAQQGRGTGELEVPGTNYIPPSAAAFGSASWAVPSGNPTPKHSTGSNSDSKSLLNVLRHSSGKS